MSGITQHQPSMLVLNSKYKGTQPIYDITYTLQQPIHNAEKCRLDHMSLVYMLNLVHQNQAQLDFSIETGPDTTHTYSVSLSSLVNNYYNSISEVVTDINDVFANVFKDSEGVYATELKPTMYFHSKTNKNLITMSNPVYKMRIISNNQNFWYKLGFPNNSYVPSSSMSSPSFPSVIPLNEMYIVIDQVYNANSLLDTTRPYHNQPAITEIVTFNDCQNGDLFVYRPPAEPTFPLLTEQYIRNVRVRLMDSIGNPVLLNSDYKIILRFAYNE
jgi:hypothetical protein